MGGQRVEDGRPPSNLQRFLDCTTPSVETHILPKRDSLLLLIQAANARLTTDAWHHADPDTAEYFNLADLWEQYYEWSAYGAGATVQLHGGDKVIQYYVPYLSGIQLYTNKVLTPSRSFAEDYSADFWSDDEDNEKMSRSWSSTSDDSFNCDVAAGNRRRPGHLYFEFFEVCSPYGRIPLMDKVSYLPHSLPTQCEGFVCMLPNLPYHFFGISRYVTVAYHVLETMTYGSAASGKQNDHLDKKANTVSLSPFGLAANKIQGSLWTNPRTGDHKRMVSLFSAADSWLKQLGVQHHDFNYFITHPM
ncbi:hypothetical protein ACQ4PT_023597 [Festuca glaucescens]